MSTGLFVAILVGLSVVIFGLIITKKKKVEFPPIITGTMPTPPEPTPEETGVKTEPEVTPLPNPSDINNEQIN